MKSLLGVVTHTPELGEVVALLEKNDVREQLLRKILTGKTFYGRHFIRISDIMTRYGRHSNKIPQNWGLSIFGNVVF